ncbi:glycosyltransferase [Promethearchaeum syntrophicum]|uniref:Glycosyltransferase n=1 Tax=Promethearchaeum syntrophicum TaxID=2594042 RepID=A0A5B9DAD0_9ARCH|nr:glycosyltransferase [Candidatus Prometheoarchaeum syntrophicum]QEE16042.1 putative glycosyl transferase [Candidatus Prometheoarchaeum syntrophicum]
MKVCLFGFYNPNYPRNRILVKGLYNNGVELYEINEPLKPNYILTFHNLKSLLFATFKLIKKSFNLPKVDYIINLYPGFNSFFLAKFFSKYIFHTPLVYDPFISLYNTWVNDYKILNRDSISSVLLRVFEKITFDKSDILLADTYHHKYYFSEEYKIPLSKIFNIFIGADSQKFFPIDPKNFALNEKFSKNKGKFIVSFIGGFIPLQGIDFILDAARILNPYKDIIFEIIGGIKGNLLFEKAKKFKKIHQLNNIIFYNFQPLDELKYFINRSDIQLGIFGESFKSKIVIPNKVFQAIACKKTVITAKTPAIKELFTDGKDIILSKPKSGKSLASKILFLYENQNLRLKIAQNGFYTYKNLLTPKILGLNFKFFLESNLNA